MVPIAVMLAVLGADVVLVLGVEILLMIGAFRLVILLRVRSLLRRGLLVGVGELSGLSIGLALGVVSLSLVLPLLALDDGVLICGFVLDLELVIGLLLDGILLSRLVLLLVLRTMMLLKMPLRANATPLKEKLLPVPAILACLGTGVLHLFATAKLNLLLYRL